MKAKKREYKKERSEVLQIRLSKEEKHIIEEKAKKQKLSLSDYIRLASCKKPAN